MFLGERPDARRLLPAMDLVVVPSLEREGLGLAALEAMDAGRPVVASRVGGLVEVVEEGRTGVLVPPGEPLALAAAIWSSSGRYGTSPMIRANSPWTLRVSASTSRLSWRTSGASANSPTPCSRGSTKPSARPHSSSSGCAISRRNAEGALTE